MIGDDKMCLQRLQFKEKSMQQMEHLCPQYVQGR